MRMVGSCIVTTYRVITYYVVACSSSRDLASPPRSFSRMLAEQYATKLDPTIRKEPVAMKQLPVRGSCSGPRQPSETGTRPTRSRSDSAIFVGSSQEEGGEHGVRLRVRTSNSASPYRKCYPARMPLKSATFRGCT